MSEIWSMGEMLVEIMRDKKDKPFWESGVFKGPYPSGAPAIFASTAARLGHSVSLIGGVGSDGFGKCLMDRMREVGVKTDFVYESSLKSTAVAFVSYSSDGGREYIFHIDGTPAVEAKAPEEKAFEGARCFHVMGCSLTTNPEFGDEILKAMFAAKSKGARISFDPNIRRELLRKDGMKLVGSVLRETNIFLPGASELLMLTGKSDVESAAAEAFKNPELEILAVKDGARGSKIYTKDGTCISMGVYEVDEVDATGAGDSFDAAFICALLEGLPIERAARISAAAGALNMAAFGPMEGKITRDAIARLVRERESGYRDVWRY